MIETYFLQDCRWWESYEGDWEETRDGPRDHQDDGWGLEAGGARTGLTNQQKTQKKTKKHDKQTKQTDNEWIWHFNWVDSRGK